MVFTTSNTTDQHKRNDTSHMALLKLLKPVSEDSGKRCNEKVSLLIFS